jgi:hypothetical protein
VHRLSDTWRADSEVTCPFQRILEEEADRRIVVDVEDGGQSGPREGKVARFVEAI